MTLYHQLHQFLLLITKRVNICWTIYDLSTTLFHKKIMCFFSGNEVDRNFSTIDKLLKETEVSSLDDLVQLIESTPLTPKPICKNVLHIRLEEFYS